MSQCSKRTAEKKFRAKFNEPICEQVQKEHTFQSDMESTFFSADLYLYFLALASAEQLTLSLTKELDNLPANNLLLKLKSHGLIFGSFKKLSFTFKYLEI